MTLDTLNLTGTYTLETCCLSGCGVQWAMPADLVRRLRRTHKLFYCPHGHGQHYSGQSDLEAARNRAAKAAARAERMEAERDEAMGERDHHWRSSRSYRGQVTKLKKRAAHGVCPCCKRTFKDLARHMTSKHPKYAESK